MGKRQEWFATSVVLCLVPEGRRRKSLRIWENIYVVQASSAREAKRKAERLGRMESSPKMEPFELKGERVRARYVGVRKVVSCSLPFHGRGEGERIEDGTEVSYSVLSLPDASELERFMSGEPARVLYEE